MAVPADTAQTLAATRFEALVPALFVERATSGSYRCVVQLQSLQGHFIVLHPFYAKALNDR